LWLRVVVVAGQVLGWVAVVGRAGIELQQVYQ